MTTSLSVVSVLSAVISMNDRSLRSRLLPDDKGVIHWVWTNRTAMAIAIANCVPIVGVLFFGWDLFDVIFLYWLENVVIGVFNVLKMLVSAVAFPAQIFVTVMLIPFFAFHYGGFCYGHGLFIFHLFREGRHDMDLLASVEAEFSIGLAIALAALALEHAYSFFTDFVKRGDYKLYPPIVYFFAPYARIVLIHVVLVCGGFLAHLIGAPAIVVVLLIPLKVALEWLTVAVKEKTLEEKRKGQSAGKLKGN